MNRRVEKEERRGKEDEQEINRIRERKMREMEEKIKGEEKEMGRKIDHPITVSDATLSETVKKYSLVIIDCWAPWCGPCKMIAPVIDELAKEYTGKAVFGKMNTDENLKTAAELGIMAIPTLLIYKNGELVDNIIGALPKRHLEDKIKKWL